MNKTKLEVHFICKFLVQYAKNRLATVSEMLYKSMKGAGTRDASLIRIILVYAEVTFKYL